MARVSWTKQLAAFQCEKVIFDGQATFEAALLDSGAGYAGRLPPHQSRTGQQVELAGQRLLTDHALLLRLNAREPAEAYPPSDGPMYDRCLFHNVVIGRAECSLTAALRRNDLARLGRGP